MRFKVAGMLLAFLALSTASAYGCDSYGQQFVAPQAFYAPQVQQFAVQYYTPRVQQVVLKQQHVQAVQAVRVRAVRQPRVEVQRIVIRRR